jgi:hypothetical protein
LWERERRDRNIRKLCRKERGIERGIEVKDEKKGMVVLLAIIYSSCD